MNYDSFLLGSILSIKLHVKFLQSVNLVPEQSISILGMYVKHISELLGAAVIFDLFVPTLIKKIRHMCTPRTRLNLQTYFYITFEFFPN